MQVSVSFDIIFIIQHYVLYPAKKPYKLVTTGEDEDQIREHLVRPSDESPPENVWNLIWFIMYIQRSMNIESERPLPGML